MDPRERFNDPEEMLRLAMEGMAVDMWTAMPGTIVSFDGAKSTASVRLGLTRAFRNPDDSVDNRAIPNLPDVPVIFPRGGGYVLTFPVAAGDPCLVVFASRNIDAWWQNGGVQAPLDGRIHDLSDGFAILGPFIQTATLSAMSGSAAQLRSLDGTTVVEVGAGTIKLTAPTKVTIDTPLVEVTGRIEAVGEVKAGTIALTTHLHRDVAVGGSNSGGPVAP